MDVSHTATAQAATAEPYECARCGYAGKGVSVAIESSTVRRGGLLFGNTRAAEMARDSAEAEAWSEAMSDVAMAACPRCAVVGRGAWLAWMSRPEYFLKAVIGILTLLAGGMLCGAIFTAANLFSAVFAAVVGAFFLVGGPLIAILPLRMKREATRRVRFDPPA